MRDRGYDKDKYGLDLVDCKYCELPTTNTGTELCDGCWELEHRMKQRPDIMEKILTEMGYHWS